MFVAEGEQPFEPAQVVFVVEYFEARERQGLAREELFDLRQMITVDVQVAEGVYELADFETADVREHVREEGIGAYVEGHAARIFGMKILCITLCVCG